MNRAARGTRTDAPGGTRAELVHARSYRLGTRRGRRRNAPVDPAAARLCSRPSGGEPSAYEGRVGYPTAIAGHRTPVEALRAIGAMPDADRLDHEDFEERYQRALQAHEAEKKRRARRRAPVAGLDAKRTLRFVDS